ncbi:hypothetical protein MMPV_008374 [Pyropia vietnamensis]
MAGLVPIPAFAPPTCLWATRRAGCLAAAAAPFVHPAGLRHGVAAATAAAAPVIVASMERRSLTMAAAGGPSAAGPVSPSADVAVPPPAARLPDAPLPALEVFACPTCGAPIADPTTMAVAASAPAGGVGRRRRRVALAAPPVAGVPTCGSCGTTFPSTADYTDMTPAAGRVQRTYSSGANDTGMAGGQGRALQTAAAIVAALTQPPKQGLFQSPVVSYLYERGWRDNFEVAGAPGPAAEAAAAAAWFAAAPVSDPATGRLVVDVSCGSGVVSRLLAASPEVGRLLALDLSAAMLSEAAARGRRGGRGRTAASDFTRLRADVSALPLRTGSVDAVHAGAALHCWPVVQDGLAEAARVLVPGGRMVATTFLNRGGSAPRRRWPPSWLPAGSALYRFFGPDELERLFIAAGFVNVTVEVLGWYAIVRAIKPE